jgi:hypothetical protein
MYVTTNYIEEVDTPASNDFVERFRAKFPMSPTSTRRPRIPTSP